MMYLNGPVYLDSRLGAPPSGTGAGLRARILTVFDIEHCPLVATLI